MTAANSQLLQTHGKTCIIFPKLCLHQSVVVFWQMSGVLCWIGRKAIVFHRYSDSGEALIS